MGDDQLLLNTEFETEIHDEMEETGEDILLLVEMRNRVVEKRYFEQRFLGSAGRLEYDLLESYLHFPALSFLNPFRLTWGSFTALAEILEAERGEEFWGQRTEGARPVRHQVAAALLALGHPAAYDDRRRDFNLSKGSLWTYTRRVIEVVVQHGRAVHLLAGGRSSSIADRRKA